MSFRLLSGDLGELPGTLRGTVTGLDVELRKATARACLLMVPRYATVHLALKKEDRVATIRLAEASLEDMLCFLGAVLVAISKGLKETFAHPSETHADITAALVFIREPMGRALSKGEPLPLSINATREAAPSMSSNTVMVVPAEGEVDNVMENLGDWRYDLTAQQQVEYAQQITALTSLAGEARDKQHAALGAVVEQVARMATCSDPAGHLALMKTTLAACKQIIREEQPDQYLTQGRRLDNYQEQSLSGKCELLINPTASPRQQADAREELLAPTDTIFRGQNLASITKAFNDRAPALRSGGTE